MITKQDIELSERLRLACAEKGITQPVMAAQDEDGKWVHYDEKPIRYERLGFFSTGPDSGVDLFQTDPNENWRDTLMQFTTPKIEVGKRYWRRDGEVTGELQRSIWIPDGFYDPVDGKHFHATGTPYGVSYVCDLIAEYREESIAEWSDRHKIMGADECERFSTDRPPWNNDYHDEKTQYSYKANLDRNKFTVVVNTEGDRIIVEITEKQPTETEL